VQPKLSKVMLAAIVTALGASVGLPRLEHFGKIAGPDVVGKVTRRSGLRGNDARKDSPCMVFQVVTERGSLPCVIQADGHAVADHRVSCRQVCQLEQQGEAR
jgi:hypothetical protein